MNSNGSPYFHFKHDKSLQNRHFIFLHSTPTDHRQKDHISYVNVNESAPDNPIPGTLDQRDIKQNTRPRAEIVT